MIASEALRPNNGPESAPRVQSAADGHATDYDTRENKYWMPINGEWMVVPPEAVVSDEGNPTGDAVVWYTMHNGTAYIRCFVPGGGA